MANDGMVTDSNLLSVMRAATEARQQSLDLIDLLNSHPSNVPDEELARQQKRLTARLAILRGLNRKAIVTVRETKQETTEARQEIDSLHLQLQNLYYEQRHLRGEIAGCEDFDHKYQRLPMVPPKDFLAAHPECADLDEHDLTLARIKDEHEARQVLEEQRLQLVKRKDAFAKVANGKKEELGRLDMELEKWVAGQEAIRKLFDTKDKREADTREKDGSDNEGSAMTT